VPKLVVRFVDDEVIEGTANEFDLDAPEFHLDSIKGSGNNRAAWIPLPAVKKIRLHSGPADAKVSGADKMVALRLQDGEVMRGYLNGGLEHHQYGVYVTLYSRDKASMERLAIPYTSMKALFYIKSWDSRPPGFQSPPESGPPLTELLGAIREITRLYESGELSRDEFRARRKDLLQRF
jgi:hypothetical protein